MKNFTTKAIAVALMVFGFGISNSYGQAYQQGDNLLNLGVGLGGGFGTPIGFSYEHGFSDKISGGVYASYSSESMSVWTSTLKSTYILAAARASYHFDFGVENLDPYLGVLLGYNIASSKWTGASFPGSSAKAGGVIYGGHAGARYFFGEKFGVFAEAGYGIGTLNVGLTFKL